MSSALLTSLEDAQALVQELCRLTQEIAEIIQSPELTREEHYVTRVTPLTNEATAKYQTLAAFLQQHRNDHDKEYRTIQRSFVQAMQDLQQVQRAAAKRREALCDADFVFGAKISAEDVQTAKEEVLEAQQIASEAVVVKKLFQEVGVIVHQQGQGIDAIEHKVETIRLEIGQGVNELQHARRLQREARQKHLVIVCVSVLILAAIIIPTVLSLL
ncbi:hypothetical protein Poli38472_002189 [Pythium oligandrum]|uniref:t-SNARE coiled-coil homology domain-containing protein n=1 Tax=Pythium oligandrum TaxID=41045 RepID=A0A8K1CIU0_PYTOL|nr:hypothetical protein Poli38472_002189 [Pythium oligandrum]|eukprot:TMW63248.1 hypothetical protein Poli38472_002189 [Pythium oligandrum]